MTRGQADLGIMLAHGTIERAKRCPCCRHLIDLRHLEAKQEDTSRWLKGIGLDDPNVVPTVKTRAVGFALVDNPTATLPPG